MEMYRALQNRLPQKYTTVFSAQPHQDEAEQALNHFKRSVKPQGQSYSLFCAARNFENKSRAISLFSLMSANSNNSSTVHLNQILASC
jgi:hypothetical protein